jgi:hypothetical protein
MADALIALVSAIIGAIIGGLLSMVGAAYAEKRVLTRSMRVRMYDEILPELRNKIAAVPTSPRAESSTSLREVEAQVQLLYRTATIAGSADQKYVGRMQELLNEIRQKDGDYHTVVSQEPHRPDITPIEGQFQRMETYFRSEDPDWQPTEAVSNVEKKQASYRGELQVHQSRLSSFEDEYKKAVDAFSQQLHDTDAYLAERIRSMDWGRIPSVR